MCLVAHIRGDDEEDDEDDEGKRSSTAYVGPSINRRLQEGVPSFGRIGYPCTSLRGSSN
jgi:hypothetical protein